MPTVRPIAHDAQLSVVDHLDELRTRLIWCVIAFIIAFAFCYWQNNTLLSWLNKPLSNAKRIDCTDMTRFTNPLERSGCFNDVLAKALREAAPALTRAGESLVQLGDSSSSASAQAAARRSRDELTRAAERLVSAADLAPRANGPGRTEPVTLGVTEPFMTTLMVSAYGALLLSLPIVLYQLFAFVLPAFKPDERRLALPAIIAAPTLFLAGVAFAYFLALPPAMRFLQNYNDSQFDILVQARDYYRFIVLLLAGVGLTFQVPLVVLTIVRMGIITPKRLMRTRGYAILIFAIVAAIVTPTPDPVTMLITMSPLVVLYEASLQLARLIEPKQPSRWARWPVGDDDDDEQRRLPAGTGLD